MKLSKEIRDTVSLLSLRYHGIKHSTAFTCIMFIREVYKEIGVDVPIIGQYIPPPMGFNITKEDLCTLECGYIVFRVVVAVFCLDVVIYLTKP